LKREKAKQLDKVVAVQAGQGWARLGKAMQGTAVRHASYVHYFMLYLSTL
jgi:hypothetical protein